MSARMLDAEQAARRVADAVLFEGYVLYPYRSTSAKNQLRWQFGMLGPVGALDAGVGEEPAMRTELVVEPAGPAADVRVGLTLRFLHPQYRAVERSADGRAGGRFDAVPELLVGAARWVPWHEAVVCEVPVAPRDLSAGPVSVDVRISADKETELLRDAGGVIAGRLVRVRCPLAGRVRLAARTVSAAGDSGTRKLLVVSVEVENVGRWEPAEASRVAALLNPGPAEATPGPAIAGPRGTARDIAARSSFAGTHVLARVEGGRFLSPTDPPEWAGPTVRERRHHRCWPVLVGEEGGPDDLALVSPIILADRPSVAAESVGDFFDATEIDEMLTLRVMTLTDAEKEEARGTDPRAAAIIDRCDTMPPETMSRLHGVVRDAVTAPNVGEFGFGTDAPWWDPASDASVSPEHDTVDVGGIPIGKGAQVRLRPTRRADAQDLFLVGQVATVAAVLHDVDGEVHVAVTLDDDPGHDLHAWYGRYYYFAPDEIELLRDVAEETEGRPTAEAAP
jgi:hypothetical protein